MKKMKFNTIAARSIKTGLAIGALVAAQGAFACTVANWNGGNSGNVTAGGPNAGSIARYSGICAMATPDGVTAWVQDDSPGGIDGIRARFYVLNGLSASQSAIVYRGFSTTGGTGNLFTVRLDTDGNVRLIDNATATEVQQSSATEWTSIEIDWSQGNGDGVISLSVNGQAPATVNNLNNSGQALQSVRVGNLLGASGILNFDAYESRRSTAVGRLCVGDANGDAEINFFDISTVFEEVQSAQTILATGQPDVDENGQINFFDVSAAFLEVQSAASCS